MNMQQFKVNEYITLKLEGGKTNIYVKDQLFRQCKFLLLNIPVDRVSSFDEIESIDEAAEKLDRTLEGRETEDYEISSKVEFWGHCSNLQVWSEMDYDTRLIHSNLAFPLLEKLTEIEDPLAIRVFKEEIAKRIGESPSLLRNLYMMGLFEFLTLEEIKNVTLDQEFLNLQSCDLQEFPSFIFSLKNLNSLLLDYNKICEIPDDIANVKRLKLFSISDNKIKEISISLSYLYNLEFLDLSNNSISHINFLKNKRIFPSLKKLNLSLNRLTEFSSELVGLKNLKELDLSNNSITIIPPLSKSLRYLNLSSNSIKFLPRSISKLSYLEILVLSENKIKDLNESLENLHSLRELYIDGNDIESIPSYLGELPSLNYLSVDKRHISKIPVNLKKKIHKKLIHLFIAR